MARGRSTAVSLQTQILVRERKISECPGNVGEELIRCVCVCVSVSLPTSFVNRLPDLSETHEPSALALSLSVSVFRIFTRIAIG